MTTAESGFAEINGTEFYYEIAGSGPPLVLIHAGICDSRMWDEQFDHFAAHFRVLRYDMRGYGQTEPVDEAYSHHTDLAALLSLLAIERAHLLGCSMGGSTALDFALVYPEKTASLIMVCAEPSGYEDEEAEDEELPEDWDQIVEAFKRGAFATVAAWEVHQWVDGPTRTPDQVDPAIRQKVLEMNTIALENEALELGENEPLEPPAFAQLEQLQVPTLIIIGDLDQASMQRAAEVMADRLPSAQKVVIANTAHLPSMEQPAQFNQIVLDFLGMQTG